MSKPMWTATRGAQRPFRFYIASLGCPKNTVDANAMAVLLQRSGMDYTLDLDAADLVIVNTCGFIDIARQESMETLDELAEAMMPHQRLIAAGCWSQREPAYLLEAVPRIDAVLGTRSWGEIVSLARRVLAAPLGSTASLVEDRLAMLPEEVEAPGYVLSGRSAFLKIADGCSRACAFCAIPSIKGPTVSRTMDAIVADARALQSLGVLEINLIAQDSTFYGYDLGKRDGLAELLTALVAAVPDVPWIRVLYAFPGYITPRLIDVMCTYPQILSYVDIPLQHAHPDVLRRMRRPADMDRVRRTLAHLRDVMPDVALRTTLIVGFPGESDREFAALLDFVKEIRFDRLGVFAYSHEPGTAAAQLEDDVPAEVKSERYDQIMVAQQAISQARNQDFVGRRLPVLLEGYGDDLTVGRSYRDAPEIDGLVLIPGEAEVHRIVEVEVTKALHYDLVGRIVAD
ncbi:MAG: 30S ribosomal protein S12 methylthiotransferase RimO [Anaerolineae bacterium]|nr:30S ribosomal protein S12 methylthiotransferase RimO [Anaerolineae bacterium]